MTGKELYSLWVEKQSLLPIFMQPWWMDAVCSGKQWDVLLVFISQEGQIEIVSDQHLSIDNVIAAMPYLIRERHHMRYVIMPQLTQIGGVWIDQNIVEEFKTDEKKLHAIWDTFSQRLQQLNLHYYYQHFPRQSSLIPIVDKKIYTVRKRITYRIADTSNIDTLIERFSKNVKRQLQKSLSLHVDWNMSAEEFFTFHSLALQEKGRKTVYTREFFLILQQKTYKQGRGSIIAVKNKDNDTCAACFVVWDNTSLYYLIPTYRNAYKNSGAGALLVLEAIKLSQSKKLAFDFEGSQNSAIAKYYKQFASEPTIYYSVEKCYKSYFRIFLFFNWLRSKKMGL